MHHTTNHSRSFINPLFCFKQKNLSKYGDQIEKNINSPSFLDFQEGKGNIIPLLSIVVTYLFVYFIYIHHHGHPYYIHLHRLFGIHGLTDAGFLRQP